MRKFIKKIQDCAESVSVARKRRFLVKGVYSNVHDRADSPLCGLQGRGATAPQPAEEARRDNQMLYAQSSEGVDTID